MARFRLIALVLVSTLLMGSSLRAEPTTKPAGRAEASASFPRIRALLDDLKLSDEQKKKVNDVFDRASENYRAIVSDLRGMNPPDRQAKMKEFFNDIREQISEVLTPEQKEKFDSSLQGLLGGSGRPGATTRPGSATSRPGPGTGNGPVGDFMIRIRRSLQELGLSDEQKLKVKKLFDETGEKFKEIASKGQRGSEEMRQKVRELLEQTRDSIKEILTPEQFEKFSSAIRAGGAGGFGGAGEKPATQPRMIEEKMKDEKMMEDKSSKDGEKEKTSSGEQQSEGSTSAPQVGEAAPAFSLQKLEGPKLQLSAFNGKVVVLTFASYSSPTFRRRAAALDDIRNKYDSRANFFLVYGKEAHPKGGWEVDRNKDEEVAVEDAKDIAGREKLAKKMQSNLKTGWPVLLDSMDNETAKAYGAGECTTIIINRDGKIYSRLQWSDPYTLRRQLEDLLTVKPTTRPAA
jgi:Spy/CpxP family protein refolding chaperone